jgi:acetyl esterase/lipase
MMKRAVAAASLLALCGSLRAAELPGSVALWPKGAPGARVDGGAEKVRLTASGEHIVSNVHAPSITVFLPAVTNELAAAVIVVPGGGHAELWMDHEGYAVAKLLADRGVAAFVLKYRLAREKGSVYTVAGDALGDVRRAIRLVRNDAAGWHIDPQRIGVMGFSAGGELALLAGTREDGGAPGSIDPIDRQSSRPNFLALAYPAIPAGLTFSSDSPPAFLLCGNQDQPAISQGLAELYVTMRRAGVHAELHIYEGAGHGFGVRVSNPMPVAAWPQRFLDWLEQTK